MLSNTYNLCENWGWYVDIENMEFLDQRKQIHNILHKNRIFNDKYKTKSFNKNLNKLFTITEEGENNEKFDKKIYIKNYIQDYYDDDDDSNKYFGYVSSGIITTFLTILILFVL